MDLIGIRIDHGRHRRHHAGGPRRTQAGVWWRDLGRTGGRILPPEAHDVVRHKLVGKIVEAYDRYDRAPTMTLPSISVDDDIASPIDLNALATSPAMSTQRCIHPDSELNNAADIDRITTLHEDWMNEPGPTDVVSFHR